MYDTLRCNACQEYKHPNEFYNCTSISRGKQYKCKTCSGKHYKEYAKANPEYVRQKRLEYKSQQPEAIRNNHLIRNYGITLKEHDEMLLKQNNRCAICNIEFDKTPHVDHCHKTGKVRGLLCIECNWMLGKADDNPTILRKAADYLESLLHS